MKRHVKEILVEYTMVVYTIRHHRFFQRLDDEGIHVVDILRFYPYRATFDFECFFNGENLPTDTDHVQWVARHVPLSVSVASNVTGYEASRCFVTDGNSKKLVEYIMT